MPKSREITIDIPPAFTDLLVPSRYKALYGGRGSAKSHWFAERALIRCIERKGSRGVCVREVQKSLKDSVKLLLEDKIQHYGFGSHFSVNADFIRTPGDGVIIFQGMQDHTSESIKSLEAFDWAYVEEAQTMTERSLELLRPTIRVPGSEIWFSWNPRHATDPVDKFFRGQLVPDNAIIKRVSYKDNPWFPDELEAERAFDERTNPQRYGHIWLGEYEPQAVGAIFSREVIFRNRRDSAPEMRRVLVSIDPPISHEPGSDEAGIIVGGLGEDQRGYVLADLSFRASPTQWAERACAAYDMYDADAIVAEINQGGDMVTNTIRALRPDIRVIPVRATRGKAIRAEPISALYALDRISHVGAFPQLEAQLCLFTAEQYVGPDSPDRADALIWMFTELFPRLTRRERPSHLPLPTRANNSYNVFHRHDKQI